MSNKILLAPETLFCKFGARVDHTPHSFINKGTREKVLRERNWGWERARNTAKIIEKTTSRKTEMFCRACHHAGYNPVTGQLGNQKQSPMKFLNQRVPSQLPDILGNRKSQSIKSGAKWS